MPARVLAFLLATLATTAPAQIRTWVSPAGMDSNPCTRDLPCRSLLAGINLVQAGGEVVAMESGGYGAVIISKPVTVLAPRGVHAAIAPTAGSAVTVAAGNFDHVMVRNFYLQGSGAQFGIDADSVGVLYVENCTISGFLDKGIQFAPATPGGRLYVSDTTLRGNNSGIHVSGGMDLRATIDSVQVQPVSVGISISNGHATIPNTIVDGGEVGFRAGVNSRVVIEDSTASNNNVGYDALAGGVMLLTRCAANGNGQGVDADGGGDIYVSDSTITQNNIGVVSSTPGGAHTRQNNTVDGNGDDGVFSHMFTPQ